MNNKEWIIQAEETLNNSQFPTAEILSIVRADDAPIEVAICALCGAWIPTDFGPEPVDRHIAWHKRLMGLEEL